MKSTGNKLAFISISISIIWGVYNIFTDDKPRVWILVFVIVLLISLNIFYFKHQEK